MSVNPLDALWRQGLIVRFKRYWRGFLKQRHGSNLRSRSRFWADGGFGSDSCDSGQLRRHSGLGCRGLYSQGLFGKGLWVQSLQVLQAPFGDGVVGIEGQHLFKTDTALAIGVHHTTQPHPGLLVVSIQLQSLIEELAGLIFSSCFVGCDSLFQELIWNHLLDLL